MEQERVHEIHLSNLPKLQERVDQLAAKARKRGLPEPSLEIIEKGWRERKTDAMGNPLPTPRREPIARVRLIGELPRLEGGWELVAIIDHRGGPGPHGYLVRQVPWTAEQGIEVPKHYRTDDPFCDHCQTHRERSDTFVILSEAGEWKRVGRQCLSEYIADQSADQYAGWLYGLHDIPWVEYGEYEGEAKWLDTRGLLAAAALMIEHYGWASKLAERNGEVPLSTASRALDWLADESDDKPERLEQRHWDEADAAIKWVAEDLAERDDLNGYLGNLLVAASEPATHSRNVGLVVSLLPARKREIANAEREAAKAKSIAESPSDHIGQIGERLDLSLTVRRVIDIEVDSYRSRYPETLKITIMEDESGNVVVWKTTSHRLPEGATFRIRGTVKEHGEYEGIKQTVLTRCRLYCPECAKPLEFQYAHLVHYACENGHRVGSPEVLEALANALS